MKSPDEESCRSEFDDFLRKASPSVVIRWHEVRQQDEPPDYYLSLDGIEYAVEVTSLMETLPVGTLLLPYVAVTRSLWDFIDQVEETAKREGYLHGAYAVGFLGPIEYFSMVKDQIRAALLNYIETTQGLESAPERVVFGYGGQRCSIQKIHNAGTKIVKAGPTNFKWEGEAAIQICSLLEERLADKCRKLRNISAPKILLLYDSYHFADKQMFKDCVTKLSDLASFHTVFVVRGSTNSFILHTLNSDWL